MNFKMKYSITSKFITPKTDRRPGIPINKVRFITNHDSGNPGATAQNHYDFYMNTLHGDKSSAQIFVDDKDILVLIPAFKNPEKAYHVMRSKPRDNELYGCDAIDNSIGVEWCYGKNPKTGYVINSIESYKKYIWTLAYLCYVYGLDPYKHNIGHFLLDPKRRSDPVSGLKTIGKNYEQFKQDVVKEYNDCTVQVQVKPIIPSCIINGKKINGILNNGKLFIPAREVATVLGKSIIWDDKTKTATIK